MSPRPALATRLYGALISLLPPHVLRADGPAMVDLFDELLVDAKSRGRTVRFLLRAYSKLFVVVTVEWGGLLRSSASAFVAGGLVSGFGRDLSVAGRSLLRARGFVATVVVLIGLGIGAVTSVFTLVDHVLLRPLPYPTPDRLVFVGDGPERDAYEAHSGPVLQALEEVTTFDAWGFADSDAATLLANNGASAITLARVSGGFFDVFGASVELGRLFGQDDFSSPDRVILSNVAWRTHFGADPRVVGQSVRIDDQVLTIVGVLTHSFATPRALLPESVAAYRPIDWAAPEHGRIDSESLEAVGRLATGVTLATAQVSMDQVAQRFAELHPDRFRDDDGNVDPMPVVPLQEATVHGVRAGLVLLLGAVGLLLVVSALNVAHLVLARGEARRQEMAVRRALGASTPRLVRQLLAESTVLGLLGGLLGIYLAHLGLSTLLAMMPGSLPVSGDVSIDVPVLLFAMAVTIATAGAVGLLPAMRLLEGGSADTLQGYRGATAGRRARRMRSGLVVAEVALSLVLIAHAGLLARSLAQVHTHAPGLDPEGVVTMPLTHTAAASGPEFVQTMDEIALALEAVPGVRTATYGINLPFEVTGGRRAGWNNTLRMVAGGQVHDELDIRLHPVTPSYFETLGVRLIAGTAWTPSEGAIPEVAEEQTNTESEDPVSEMPVVLGAKTATIYFGSPERAAGQVVWSERNPARRWRVTGVAEDTRFWGLDQATPNAVYLPANRMPRGFRRAHMAVRAANPSPALYAQLREAVQRAAPAVPVSVVRPMQEWIDQSTAGRRFDSVVFGLFGAIGLLLASSGLYGTLLFHVRLRRREIGVRLALGATSGRVQREVVGDAIGLALMGSVLGLAGVALTGRFLAGRLYEVTAFDPLTMLLATTLLVGTVVFASWQPARRAGRIDPIEALRSD